jgi:hypothetical protein
MCRNMSCARIGAQALAQQWIGRWNLVNLATMPDDHRWLE